MNKCEIKTSVFKNGIKDAVKKLQNNQFIDAYKIILDTMCVNPNAPETHNLLGLWYEMTGEEQLARKHYRISYVLDPGFKPACNNLERISTLFLTKEIPYDFGDETDQLDQVEARRKQNVRKPNQ